MKYAFIAVLLLAGTAHAERFSAVNGSKLLEMCTAKDTTDCSAYIEGVSDTMNFYQKLRPADKPGKLPTYVCVPPPATGAQLRETVVTYAKSHTDMLDKQASGIVLRALDGAYRCK